MKTAVLFANNKAGSQEKAQIIQTIRDFLEKHDYQVLIKEPATVDEAKAQAKAAAQEKVDLVIPIGGDGTINKICGGVFEGGGYPIIGILPSGTVNNFAKSLGIPFDMQAALENLIQGQVRGFDIASVNEDYMISSLTLGYLADIAQNVHSEDKRRWGKLAFLKDFYRVIKRNRTYSISIETKAAVYPLRTKYLLITMTNTIAGQDGFDPSSAYNDGLLNLFSLKRVRLFKILWHLKDLRRGNFDQFDELSHLKTDQLIIHSRAKKASRIPFSRIDGDQSPALPLKIQVHHKGLKTIVPKQSNQHLPTQE